MTLPSFKLLCSLLALLFLVLALGHLVTPGLIMNSYGADASPGAAFMARRAALLYLGLAMIAGLLRDQSDRTVRRVLCAAFAVVMAALAVLGIAEWMFGMAGPQIIPALCIESSFAALFWLRRQKS